MKVLTIVSDLGYRGTQRAAQNYSIALAGRGHQVVVLALNAGGSREEFLRQKGIHTVWIGANRLQQAMEEAARFKADVIHIHRPGMHDPLWGLVLQKLKVPGVRVLETNVFGRVDYSADASLIDVHLQISRWCLYRWRQWLGRRKQVGVYLPYPVDTDNFPVMEATIRHESRKSFDLPPAGIVCGRIGKWTPQIFHAFESLVRRRPDALLLNVLDHTDARDFAVNLSAEVRSRIVSIPKLRGDSALARFYASLDCLLQVSPNGESFGMVLAEAMACGTPVVTASTPHRDNAQVEVVKHNQGGVVAGSAARLGEALIAFCENTSLQRACSSQARHLITERFESNDISRKLEAIAKHALASKDREDLADRLKEDDNIETDIAKTEVEESLKNTFGKYSNMELMLMNLVHNPLIYRFYSHLKHKY